MKIFLISELRLHYFYYVWFKNVLAWKGQYFYGHDKVWRSDDEKIKFLVLLGNGNKMV